MKGVKNVVLADAPTEIVFEVIPEYESFEAAQKIIEKIREANKGCTLRVEVRNVSR